MYKTNFANLIKKIIPDFDASRLLNNWVSEDKKRGEVKSAAAYAAVFGLSVNQYQQILSVLLIIRSDRQLRIIPENYKKIVAILAQEFPEFANKRPNPFYGIINDLKRHEKEPYTKSILDKSWTSIKSAAVVSRGTKKAAVKAKNVVVDDLLKPVSENIGSTFKLVGFLTNPYVLLAGAGAYVYFAYVKPKQKKG